MKVAVFPWDQLKENDKGGACPGSEYRCQLATRLLRVREGGEGMEQGRGKVDYGAGGP